MRVVIAVLVASFATLPATVADASDFKNIQTPSGNIHCQFNDGMNGNIDCEILESTPSEDLPARPADCDVEWGKRFVMNATGPSQMVCYGDTVRKSEADIIPYGGTFSLYGITCVSERTGLICTNEDGRGFLLSKAKQELF